MKYWLVLSVPLRTKATHSHLNSTDPAGEKSFAWRPRQSNNWLELYTLLRQGLNSSSLALRPNFLVARRYYVQDIGNPCSFSRLSPGPNSSGPLPTLVEIMYFTASFAGSKVMEFRRLFGKFH